MRHCNGQSSVCPHLPKSKSARRKPLWLHYIRTGERQNFQITLLWFAVMNSFPLHYLLEAIVIFDGSHRNIVGLCGEWEQQSGFNLVLEGRGGESEKGCLSSNHGARSGGQRCRFYPTDHWEMASSGANGNTTWRQLLYVMQFGSSVTHRFIIWCKCHPVTQWFLMSLL